MKIHPTAIVDRGAELAEGVEIGPWCIVGAGVQIDTGTRLMSHVVIEGRTKIGKNNTFFPFSVIGAIPQDLKYRGEPTRVEIGDHNTIRESVTINLGTVQGTGVTRMGDHNLLMAYVHMGHDSQVMNHCILANNVGLAGHVVVEDYANIGGHSPVVQYLRVGKHSYMGLQTGIVLEPPPFCIVVGQRPCMVKGVNIVGLRRRGMPTEKIQVLNEAVKLWTRPDIQRDQCLLEIESQYGDSEEVQYFLNFIRTSKVGVAR